MTETIAHTAVEVPEGTTSPELEAYSAAMQVAQDFREANSLVLDTWQLMQAEIQRLEDALIEPVDVIAGGFPCQPVSVAGKRR